MNYFLLISLWSYVLIGFALGIGLGFAYILFQISLLTLRQIYISYVVRQLTKKPIPKKPKGMVFGQFNA